MKPIEMDIWNPIPDNPQRLAYAGQRTAGEVFEELKTRLESTGYLPDEYFLMDYKWQNGREIPRNANLFVTTDYGASEGIYLDVYLKWYDEEQSKSVTENFITGKTLGDTGSDMDRMYLISSAITKAFHGDGEHARYIAVGDTPQKPDMIMHLNAAERRLLIESLVESRENPAFDIDTVDKLLRRVTGSITEFINETGARPKSIDDYDFAVLTIQDGNLAAFKESLAKLDNRSCELLPLAAGRPGTVGFKMTKLMLDTAKGIPAELYENACLEAIKTGDANRVLFMAEKAESCVDEFDVKLFGKLMSKAFYLNKGHIARAVLEQCTPEQIKAADPIVLVNALSNKDIQTACAIVKHGLDVNPCADSVIFALNSITDHYLVDILMRNGMRIDNDNYAAMRACIRTGNTEAGILLLNNGMDFDEYTLWAEKYDSYVAKGDVFDELETYWTERIKDEPEISEEAMNMM